MNTKPHIHEPQIQQVGNYEARAVQPTTDIALYFNSFGDTRKPLSYNWNLIYGDNIVVIAKEVPPNDRPTQQQIAESLEKVIALHDEASKVAWTPKDYAKDLMRGKNKHQWASEQYRGLWLFRRKVAV